MAKRLYIAYGSNLNLRQMAMRCPTAKLYGTGEVPGYELQFKGQPHGAFATIGPVEGASVPVAVWELRAADERALDLYEGYPSHYFKKDVPVQVNGETVTAMAYIMNQKMEYGIPTQRYYNAVLEGYENCGLDATILNEAVDKSIAEYRKLEEQQKLSRISRQCEFDAWHENDFMDEDDLDDEDWDEDLDEDWDEEEATNDHDMDDPDETDPFYVSDQMHF